MFNLKFPPDKQMPGIYLPYRFIKTLNKSISDIYSTWCEVLVFRNQTESLAIRPVVKNEITFSILRLE